MEQNIKEVFDKVYMDEHKRTEIRNSLKKKRYRLMWTKAAACAALVMAVLMAVPATRTMIIYAAEKIVQIFHTADGGEVTYGKNDHGYYFSVSDPADPNYVEVSGHRIYLKVKAEKIDVTEYCDKDSYYRCEIVQDDGSRSVIFVGGSIEKVGYVELVFDENGKYVFNKMYVPISCDHANVEPWVDKAMHSENVPTGNWELDKELYEKDK